MRHALALAALLVTTVAAAPAAAQTAAPTAAELEAELEAQKQINALLKQRIETLEAELAGRTIPPPPRAATAPAPVADDPETERALERALERRGTAVLAPSVVEITPGLSWSHSGRDALSSTDDIYAAGLEARVGLPGGWMLGAAVPLLHRDVKGAGDNTGLGDVSATVWKSLLAPTDARPSLVGSLRYGAPTGDDFAEDAVPLGSGFHRLTARLAAARTLDPIAFFGDVSYTHFLSETISGVDVDRSGVFGVGLGASLAVSPDITLSAGLDFAFEDEIEINGAKVSGSDTTTGMVELGAGVVLSKDVFLTFTGAFGITDDSPDVTLGMSLPIRF